MARYWISAGIGKSIGGSNDMGHGRQYPPLVIFGPSGNAGVVLGMSGVASKRVVSNTELHQSELTFSHVAVAWFRNEAFVSFRSSYAATGDDNAFAWQPYGQYDGQRANDTFTTSKKDFSNLVSFDGNNWKTIGYGNLGSVRTHTAGLSRANGIFWAVPHDGAQPTIKHGVYKGDDPIFQVVGAESGWIPLWGDYGSPDGDPNYNLGADAAGSNIFAGIAYDINSSISHNVMDMVDWNGTIYVAGQYYMAAFDPRGSRGSMIYFDSASRELIESQTEAVTYTDRATASFAGGGVSRSLALHNIDGRETKLVMLSNDGKIYNVRPGGITQIADLTNLATPWSSGVFGGSQGNSTSSWAGSKSAYRCKLLSFNKQLHAFINFRSSFRNVNVSDASISSAGKGIMWATSHDGVNWSDRSDMLPSSGIHSASGGGAIEAGMWKVMTSPYIFSAFTGPGTTSFGPSGSYPEVYELGEGSGIGSNSFGPGIQPAQPSGFSQPGPLPYLTNLSGVLLGVDQATLLDDVHASFESLQIPLRRAATSGYLFPTLIAYPEAFIYKDANTNLATNKSNPHAILVPSGTGVTGYDYTGCKNYHVAGHVDEQQQVMRLIFTEDYEGTASPVKAGGTLYYELNATSGWTLKNELPETNQLNGFVPCLLYDPEIIIPSGGVLNPNPNIDHVNKIVTVNYTLHDWPFYNKFKVKGEYTLDGRTWATIQEDTEVTSGSAASDPSGVTGQQNTFVWNYESDLGKNAFHSSVQIRLKATRT